MARTEARRTEVRNALIAMRGDVLRNMLPVVVALDLDADLSPLPRLPHHRPHENACAALALANGIVWA